MATGTGSHGGEVYSIARKLGISPDSLLDFSSNANIFALPITESLVRATPYPFAHYPDSSSAELIEAVALHERTEPERILPGNGAADLIWLAVQSLAPRKVLCIGPVFSEFIAALHAFDVPCTIVTPPVENDFHCTAEDLEKIWNSNADLVILCTPNNPAAVTYDNIRGLLDMLRAPRVIIDNSYREFLHGTDSFEANHLHAYQACIRPGVSLFTLHSFTKFFCCPGIRLGYLMGDRIQLARMAGLRPSWNISTFAQVMGRSFLAAVDSYRETLPQLRASAAELGRELRRLPWIRQERVYEGPGFLCCGLAQGFSAADVFRKLLHERILVRNCDTIPGMPPGFIRLRAHTAANNARLLEALEKLS